MPPSGLMIGEIVLLDHILCCLKTHSHKKETSGNRLSSSSSEVGKIDGLAEVLTQPLQKTFFSSKLDALVVLVLCLKKKIALYSSEENRQ